MAKDIDAFWIHHARGARKTYYAALSAGAEKQPSSTQKKDAKKKAITKKAVTKKAAKKK